MMESLDFPVALVVGSSSDRVRARAASNGNIGEPFQSSNGNIGELMRATIQVASSVAIRGSTMFWQVFDGRGGGGQIRNYHYVPKYKKQLY